MYGDFSRWTHDAAHRYRRVLQQQGRILLDADWNALNALLLDEIQGLASDVIGAHGGPAGNCGFRVVPKPGDLAVGDPDKDRLQAFANTLPAPGLARKDEFFLTGGHYWVDGLLCVLPTDTTYRQQPDWPPFADSENREPLDVTAGGFLISIQVWERHQTDHDAALIREVALLGPDTCTRTKIVWQVRAEPMDLDAVFGAATPLDRLNAAIELADIWLAEHSYPSRPMRRPLSPPPKLPRPPLFRAWVSDGPSIDDPCILPADARFRGRENQLYRFEIHNGGTDEAAELSKVTFKVSRDNGSVTFPLITLNGATATVEHLGRDRRSGLSDGDIVEILDDMFILHGDPGVLARVQSIDSDENTIMLEYSAGVSPPVYDATSASKPFLRRWDHKGDMKKNNGALSVAAAISDQGFPIEAGILAQFVQVAGDPPMRYRTGDYWLVPARTATGNVEWPSEMIGGKQAPMALPPAGIRRHYAPIALIRNGEVLSLRRVFGELAQEPPAGP